MEERPVLDVLGVYINWIGQKPHVLCHRRGDHFDYSMIEGRLGGVISTVKEWMQRYPAGIVFLPRGIVESGVRDALFAAGLGDRLHEVDRDSHTQGRAEALMLTYAEGSELETEERATYED